MAIFTKSVEPMFAGQGRQAGLCLLFVEDDDADAYLIRQALLKHPAVGTVVHALDGVEALRMVEEGQVDPDMAFIDLHMPRKNGFQLLVSLSQCEGGGFPMVVLTSSASPGDAQRSRLRSAIRVITKPESVPQLETALNAAIDEACPDAIPRAEIKKLKQLASAALGSSISSIDN